MADKDELKTVTEEIDAGVEQLVQDIEADKKPDDTDDPPVADDEDAGKDDDENKDAAADDDAADGDDDGEDAADDGDDSDDDGDDGDDAITDEHLERAVKAGLTMAEARRFGSADLLDTMISRLEGSKADDGESDGQDDADGDGDDPLAAIPDLDPEEYDEKIVNGFKALKDIVRAQQETIRGMRETPAASADWFKTQVAGLDKAVSSAIEKDTTKLEAVRDKFSVLEAGYKASGRDMSREAVFQEAVRVTMGDVISQAAADERAKQLGRRSRQHIQRPAGHRATPKGDPMQEVAAEIEQKYFAKT